MANKAEVSKMITLKQAAEIIGCTHGRLCQIARSPDKSKELKIYQEKCEHVACGYVWKMPKEEAERFRDNRPSPGRPRSGKS